MCFIRNKSGLSENRLVIDKGVMCSVDLCKIQSIFATSDVVGSPYMSEVLKFI